MNQNAVTIQRRWRGYLGRAKYRIHLRVLVREMEVNHYNKLATLIQKVWRGWYCRKYILNFYFRKRYLDNLQIQNENVRQSVNEYWSEKEKQTRLRIEKEIQELRELQAMKEHFLLSTTITPGVLKTSPLPDVRERENLMRSLTPKLAQEWREMGHHIIPESPYCITPGSPFYVDICKQNCPLPPVFANKLQGPFEAPEKVYYQRFKPLEPTVRVATSFTTEEDAIRTEKRLDWLQQVSEKTFQPVRRRTPLAYTPCLHTTSIFGDIPHGSKHFRDPPEPSKIVATERFQPVVPPIPLFEKLGKTYTRGATY